MIFTSRVYLYQNTLANSAWGFNSGWQRATGGIPSGSHDVQYLDGNNFEIAEVRSLISDDPSGIFRKTITGVSNSGGAFRVTFTPAISANETAAGMVTGSHVAVGQINTPASINGEWTATIVNSTTIDLQGSTFTSGYTSGGFLFGGPLDLNPIFNIVHTVPGRLPGFNDAIGGIHYSGQSTQHYGQDASLLNGPQSYAATSCFILDPDETATGCAHGFMAAGVVSIVGGLRNFHPSIATMRGMVGLAPGYELPGQLQGTQANFKAADKGFQTINMGIGYFANNAPIGRPTGGAHKNLVVKNDPTTPNSKIFISADAVALDGPIATCTGGTTMPTTTTATGFPQAVDFTVSGANGLDTGSRAANTWYSLWIIYNSSTGVTACLGSASATSPTMPSGYDYKARVGWARTDGSGNFYRFITQGKKTQYIVTPSTNTAILPVLNSGAQGNPIGGTPTWSTTSVSSFAPPTASSVRIMLSAGGGVASSVAICAPNTGYSGYGFGSAGAPFQYYIGTVGGAVVGEFMLETSNVYYACNLASGALSLLGFEDNL